MASYIFREEELSSALIHDDLLVLDKGVKEQNPKISEGVKNLFSPEPYNLGKESVVTWFEIYQELQSIKYKEDRSRTISEKTANVQREWVTPENKKEI